MRIRARLILLFSSFWGWLPLPAAAPIEIAFAWGNPDYVQFGITPFEAQMPFQSVRNLESFAIKHRAWSLLGEFVAVSEFYYAVDRRSLQGDTRKISYQQVAKYPDLVARYDAIRPNRVEYVLIAMISAESFPSPRTVCFKVTDNDLVYFESRSGKNYATPGSPARWKDAVTFDGMSAFTPADPANEQELRKMVSGFRGVENMRVGGENVRLQITWPGAEIDRIAELFERYEKEDKKIADDYAYLQDAPMEKPFAGPAEAAQPHDFQPKAGEGFQNGDEVGIKVNGEVSFRSRKHFNGAPLTMEKTHFLFALRNGWSCELIDTKGRLTTIVGYTRFLPFKSSASGNLRLVALTASPALALRTHKEYFGLYDILTQSEFDNFAQRDARPLPSRPPSSGGGVVISAPSYPYAFYRGELLELDKKMNVLSREPVYLPRVLR